MAKGAKLPERFTVTQNENCAITLPLALLPLKLGKHPQLPSGQPRYGVAGTASWIGD
jgi:hypothetical protein